MLRGEPVIGHHHVGIGKLGQVRGDCLVAVRAAGHVAAAMQVEHGALRMQWLVVAAGHIGNGLVMAADAAGLEGAVGHDVQPAPLRGKAETGVGDGFEQQGQGLAQNTGQQLLNGGLAAADAINKQTHRALYS